MRASKLFSIVLLSGFLALTQLNANAKKENLNVRGKHFNPVVVLSDLGMNAQVSATGTKLVGMPIPSGTDVATATLLFDGVPSSSLAEGQVYEIAGVNDSAETKAGRVLIIFSQIKSTLTSVMGASSNNDTIANSGFVKILRENENGTFLISFKGVFQNYSKATGVPGDITYTPTGGTITAKGYFTTLPE